MALSDAQADQVATLLNERNELTVHYTRHRVLEHSANYLCRFSPTNDVLACVELKKVQWYQAEVLHLTVAASEEGKGHAKALLHEVEDVAKERGARLLQCTIRESNVPSRGLFESFGYSHVSTFLNEASGNNVAVLQKVLVSPVEIPPTDPSTSRDMAYIIWQNRAFRFYLGARLCYLNTLFAPAAFAAQQALESLLKATLIYWDQSFDPEVAAHRVTRMLRTLENKVPGATGGEVPTYFYFEGRYQTTSRYPTGSKGLGVPASFLLDLDLAFYDLVRLVPFQFNSELVRLLAAPDSQERRVLTRGNQQIRKLTHFLKVKRGRAMSDPGHG